MVAMMRLRQGLRISFLLVFLSCVEGGKDRDTPPPLPETPTSTISLVPTTKSPNEAPSTTPSFRPSISPSMKPSATPTNGPTASPTITPRPTESPSSAPSSETEWLDLPPMQFILQFPAGTVMDSQVLEYQIDSFLQYFLSHNAANRDSFVSAELDSSATFDTTVGQATVKTQGQAEYQGPNRPTQDGLERTITTYFTFWGTEDLEEKIAETMPISSVQVKIDGQLVNAQGTSPATSPTTSKSSSSSASAGLIAGVVIASIFVITAGLLVIRSVYQRRQSEEADKHIALGSDLGEDDTNRQSDSPSPKAPILLPPPRPISHSLGSDEMRSLSGLVSLEESLFTTGDAHRPMTYDASRLDQVISSAKGFADENEQ